MLFRSENIGCAICDQGYCLTTSDGGDTWTPSLQLTYHWLGKIKFGDKNHAWITGEYGQILFSADAGKTWTIQKEMGYEGDYYDISSPTPNVAYMVGDGGMFKTTNGGQAWEELIDSPRGKLVSFIDENNGWFAYYGSYGKTSDGGHTWEIKSLEASSSIVDLTFTDINNGWMIARKDMNSQIYRTHDGGNNWIKEKDESIYLIAMSIPNNNFGFFYGSNLANQQFNDMAFYYSKDAAPVGPTISTNTSNNSIDFGNVKPGKKAL